MSQRVYMSSSLRQNSSNSGTSLLLYWTWKALCCCVVGGGYMDGLVSGNGGGGNSYAKGIYMNCYLIVVRRKCMFLHSAKFPNFETVAKGGFEPEFP